MPHYVLLMNWTEQGVQRFKDSVERSDAARSALAAVACLESPNAPVRVKPLRARDGPRSGAGRFPLSAFRFSP